MEKITGDKLECITSNENSMYEDFNAADIKKASEHDIINNISN